VGHQSRPVHLETVPAVERRTVLVVALHTDPVAEVHHTALVEGEHRIALVVERHTVLGVERRTGLAEVGRHTGLEEERRTDQEVAVDTGQAGERRILGVGEEHRTGLEGVRHTVLQVEVAVHSLAEGDSHPAAGGTADSALADTGIVDTAEAEAERKVGVGLLEDISRASCVGRQALG